MPEVAGWRSSREPLEGGEVGVDLADVPELETVAKPVDVRSQLELGIAERLASCVQLVALAQPAAGSPPGRARPVNWRRVKAWASDSLSPIRRAISTASRPRSAERPAGSTQLSSCASALRSCERKGESPSPTASSASSSKAISGSSTTPASRQEGDSDRGPGEVVGRSSSRARAAACSSARPSLARASRRGSGLGRARAAGRAGAPGRRGRRARAPRARGA